MKSLRGKRGEDLIFHGSGEASQLGKARVGITFDNTGQTFPIDFSEITISREVYRDGANEYRVNDSSVRLKDIIELMSNVGIGGSGHHIISQGEADRVLYASLRERKNMVEDALGLRIYHIKQQEAERKLASTAENMREVSLLRREIQPHMRFLRGEAEKIESSQKMRDELEELLRAYINREGSSLDAARRVFEEREEPLREELKKAEKEVETRRRTVLEQQSLMKAGVPKEMELILKELGERDAQRQTLERDLGRLEGELAMLLRAQKETSSAHSWSSEEVESELHAIVSLIDAAVSLRSVDDLLKKFSELKERVLRFLRPSAKAVVSEKNDSEFLALKAKQETLQQKLQAHEAEKKELLTKRSAWEENMRKSQSSFWEDQKLLREAEERIHTLKDALRALETDRERLRLRADELKREREEADPLIGAHMVEESRPWEEEERLKAHQKIQRLRIKLEEAGGVNPQILQEYEEVGQRDAFLAKELDDLGRTEKSLQTLRQQLEEELQHSFTEGVKKINGEFNELFRTMFGGGSAKLMLVKLQSKEEEGDLEIAGSRKVDENPRVEFGVDIAVDIPRKRVKNLDMLSGGERALTSIALLFAMSFVNPPPFLVLDETDAALDEANSQRYGALLRNLSDKTQLIVITHNRQTMKEARVLYGVTMGSDGISRLLSLKFEEATEMSGKTHESMLDSDKSV
ncbi:MAG: Chromosome partition protein smc, partial [Parcubacteria group bacterium Gr01-1014_70]